MTGQVGFFGGKGGNVHTARKTGGALAVIAVGMGDEKRVDVVGF